MNFSKSAAFTLALVMVVITGATRAPAATYPEFPYSPTNFDETWRGNYSFSQQSGNTWDTCGFWYYGGTYHLSYASNPHSREYTENTNWHTVHWGHSTSTDLLHWQQETVMLEPRNHDPGGNVPGACWDGSTIVDTDNTSKLQTGSNPVFLTYYMARHLRATFSDPSTWHSCICLAYSNDLGATWQYYNNPSTSPTGELLSMYDGNRAFGDPGLDTPQLFWHVDHWVMVTCYNSGAGFYTSTDLINWTLGSTYNGYYGSGARGDAPELNKIPVDGGGTSKWVFWGEPAIAGGVGSGSTYSIGTFDGYRYTPDPNAVYDLNLTAYGGYCGKTLSNGPDNRVIRMCWNNNPWGCYSGQTFPVELHLRTIPGLGLRMVSNPVAEIGNLYDSSRYWGPQTLASANLLAGVVAKSVDIQAEFDLANTTAANITFTIADQILTYNIPNHTFSAFGLAAAPFPATADNKLKIRMLVDKSFLQVHGNDGIFNWNISLAPADYGNAAAPKVFDPNSGFLSLKADGNVSLVKMNLFSMQRTKPVNPSYTRRYEGESATLTKQAGVAANHLSYSGSGFVHGYYDNDTAKASFAVEVPATGFYKMIVRYSAGNGASSNIGLYVNGAKLRNITFDATDPNWDTWNNTMEVVKLSAGANTIDLKADAASTACINLDYISLNAATFEAENAVLKGNASANTSRIGYSGTSFVGGYVSNSTARTTFNIKLSDAATCLLGIRYAAGSGTSSNIGLYVNGTKLRFLTFNGTGSWDAWRDQTETVALSAWSNTIELKADGSSARSIALDYISLAQSGRYDSWSDSWSGPVLADKAILGDPDNDGITNLLEYVLGGDPRQSGISILPAAATVGANGVLSYPRSDDSETDTTQVGQWSSDMAAWHDLAPVLVNENGTAPDSMEIRIPLSNAADGKLFGRLHVTKR
jgi:sucrose-6-phosphate hydrolase SacC (GH32 family)